MNDTLESACRLLDSVIARQSTIKAEQLDACRKLATRLRREGFSEGSQMIEDRLQALRSSFAVSPRLKAAHLVAAIEAFTDEELQRLDGEMRYRLWQAVSKLNEALNMPPGPAH